MLFRVQLFMTCNSDENSFSQNDKTLQMSSSPYRHCRLQGDDFSYAYARQAVKHDCTLQHILYIHTYIHTHTDTHTHTHTHAISLPHTHTLSHTHTHTHSHPHTHTLPHTHTHTHS